MIESSHDIVVTGLGAISSAGVGIEPLISAVRSGCSHLAPIPADIDGKGALWGKADMFRAADFMPPLKARKFDRCSLFAVAATGMALRDAGLEQGAFDPQRIGILLGCGFGGIANSADFLGGYFAGGAEGLTPMLFPNTVANASASNASIEHGIKGSNVTFVQRFCSAETALMMACRFLDEGRADIVVTGGVDELTPQMIKAFRLMGQLGSYAAGFGEGAGILVLERQRDARQRGARVRGKLASIRTVGLLPAKAASEGVNHLVPTSRVWSSLSLSGTADICPPLLKRLPAVPCLNLSTITGRSLAMGGLSMAALLLSLSAGETGLHVAASPEGPYYAVDFIGGGPD